MKTIQINNKHYIECGVVILATDRAENFPILKNINGRGNHLYNPTKGYYYTQSYLKEEKWEAQHLYITSDEEIKEGDWYIHFGIENNTKKQYHTLNQCHKGLRQIDLKWFVDGMYASDCKKIIATTDDSLLIRDYKFVDDTPSKGFQGFNKKLPQIPSTFIQHYITEYNKGNVISKVFVEVVDNGGNRQDSMSGCWISKWEIKLNENNEISITLDEAEPKLYSREEVEKLIKSFADDCEHDEDLIYYHGRGENGNKIWDNTNLENWIEQNL